MYHTSPHIVILVEALFCFPKANSGVFTDISAALDSVSRFAL